jgi:hypothetical protein
MTLNIGFPDLSDLLKYYEDRMDNYSNLEILVMGMILSRNMQDFRRPFEIIRFARE